MIAKLFLARKGQGEKREKGKTSISRSLSGVGMIIMSIPFLAFPACLAFLAPAIIASCGLLAN
jgi:hypothetical protein